MKIVACGFEWAALPISKDPKIEAICGCQCALEIPGQNPKQSAITHAMVIFQAPAPTHNLSDTIKVINWEWSNADQSLLHSSMEFIV